MKVFRTYALLLWVAVPLIAFEYWTHWEKLPPKLITGFDPKSLQYPITFATRTQALLVGLVSSATIALIGSAASQLGVRRQSANLGTWLWLVDSTVSLPWLFIRKTFCSGLN